MKGLFLNVFPSVKLHISKFTTVRLFTMNKKLWKQNNFEQTNTPTVEIFKKPLTKVYVAYVHFKYYYNQKAHKNHIEHIAKYQHVGLINWIFFNHYDYYPFAYFQGGHIGICKKYLSHHHPDPNHYSFLANTIIGGHTHLLTIYLRYIPVDKSTLSQLLFFLVVWIGAHTGWFRETAEILIKAGAEILINTYHHLYESEHYDILNWMSALKIKRG